MQQNQFGNNQPNFMSKQNPQPMSGISYRSAQIPLRPMFNPTEPQRRNYFQPVVQNPKSDFVIEKVHNTEHALLDADFSEQAHSYASSSTSPSYADNSSNANADALSRIELQNNDTSPIETQIVDADIDQLSMVANNRTEVPQDETQTVHTSLENPTLEIPMCENTINTCNNQIFIEIVHHSPQKPITKQIFPNKRRTYVQISQNNFDSDIISFFKDQIDPNVTYGIYLSQSSLIPKITAILQTVFKSSSLKLKFFKEKIV